MTLFCFNQGVRGCAAYGWRGDVNDPQPIALRMNKALVFIGVLLLGCASGCVESDYPLTEAESAAVAEEVLGLWQGENDKTRQLLCVERVIEEDAPKGLLRVRFPDKPEGKGCLLWATRVGDVTFLNIPIFRSPSGESSFVNGNDLTKYRKWAKGEKRPVVIFMLKRDGDQMLLWGDVWESHKFVGDPKETLKTLASDPSKFFTGEPTRYTRVPQEPKGSYAAAPPEHSSTMLLMVHDIAQAHLVVEALKAMALHGVPEKEFETLYAKLVGLDEVLSPLLKQEMEDNAKDDNATALLKEIADLQRIVRVKADAVRRLAIENAGPKGVMDIVTASIVFEERLAKILRKFEQAAPSAEAAPEPKRVQFKW